MLTVFLPPRFFEERRYAWFILLQHLLGIDLRFERGENDVTVLSWDTGTLDFQDQFFNRFEEPLGYCTQSALPAEIDYWVFGNKQVPVLYGKAGWSDHRCLADFAASSFFMLTRWEEQIVQAQDSHNRFKGKHSVAFKHGFLDQPVVHDYADIIGDMLHDKGFVWTRPQRQFSWSISHDLDIPYKWSSVKRLGVSLGGDILKRKSLPEARRTLMSFYNTRLKGNPDPFDNYDKLMDWSESLHTRSTFNIMAASPSKMDEGYNLEDPNIQRIFKRIKDRGHYFGFHPGYGTVTNPAEWKRQHQYLESVLNQRITTGRQHFLCGHPPDLWQLWADMGMTIDSTGGYADVEGFRFGMCVRFPVFNVKTRQPLPLLELPLIFMEVTVAEYQAYSPQQFLARLSHLCETVKEKNGEMTVLWHNHCMQTAFWKPYQDLVISL